MGVGRKPLPAKLHVINGTRLRGPGAGPEFTPVEDFPAPPPHLNVDGVKIWNELGRELVASGILQTVDLYALSMLAYGWQRHMDKAKAGKEISAAEDSALRSMFAEFGATPSARRRVTASGDPAKANRFQKFKPPSAANEG